MAMPIPVLDVMTDDLEPWPMAAEQILSGPPRDGVAGPLPRAR